MATVNYATKYADVVDERFALGSLTAGIVNNNFDWVGVKTVKVFSRNLATLGDYKTSGSNRYGEPDELPICPRMWTLSLPMPRLGNMGKRKGQSQKDCLYFLCKKQKDF